MISSVRNDRVKALLRLRKRRERDETGTFLIEGYRELQRARGAVQLERLYTAHRCGWVRTKTSSCMPRPPRMRSLSNWVRRLFVG